MALTAVETETSGSGRKPPGRKRTMLTNPEDIPEGYALVPLGQLTIAEATTQAGRDYWLQTMPPVLQVFTQLTPALYWQLTAAEHAHLVRWLEQTGVIGGSSNP